MSVWRYNANVFYRQGSENGAERLSSRSSSSHSSRHGSSDTSSRQGNGEVQASPRVRLGTGPSAGDSVTSVRISRKDLRRMSAEEITLRMSAISDVAPAGGS